MFTITRAIVLSLVMLTAIMLPVSAGVYQFVPSDADLQDLPHEYYFSWGIAWAIPAGEQIAEAKLFINDINDWTNEANDHLYINLLDSAPLGIRRYTDNQGGGNNWAANPLIADYSDTNSYSVDLTYKFSDVGLISTLTNYVNNDGRFGLGFDPDCHYYNCGVKLTITTETKEIPPVPEPSGIAAFAVGLTSLAGLLRRRSA